MSHASPQSDRSNPRWLIGVILVFAVQAGVAKFTGKSWGEALLPFLIACVLLVPFFLFVLRRPSLAAATVVWGAGLMFAALPFAMALGSIAAELVAPPTASALASWATPARTRTVIVLGGHLVGFLSGALLVWAAWRALPAARRAA
jgi:hypothetical protein